ncbi:hypothetical protein Tco_0637233 [Tanacetum coccineum]
MVMPCGKTRGHTWQATWTPDPTRPGHNTVPTTVDWPSIAIGRWLTGGPADVHEMHVVQGTIASQYEVVGLRLPEGAHSMRRVAQKEFAAGND